MPTLCCRTAFIVLWENNKSDGKVVAGACVTLFQASFLFVEQPTVAHAGAQTCYMHILFVLKNLKEGEV